MSIFDLNDTPMKNQHGLFAVFNFSFGSLIITVDVYLSLCVVQWYFRYLNFLLFFYIIFILFFCIIFFYCWSFASMFEHFITFLEIVSVLLHPENLSKSVCLRSSRSHILKVPNGWPKMCWPFALHKSFYELQFQVHNEIEQGFEFFNQFKYIFCLVFYNNHASLNASESHIKHILNKIK